MTDLTIVGLGISSIEQLTYEAEYALRNSRETLYLDTGVATRRFIESRCPLSRALYSERYTQDDNRLGIYQSIAIDVIEAALDNPPITFAIHGHPTIGVYAPFLVTDLAQLLGVSTRIIPGISAIDTICAGLMIDPCVTGLQMYEATDLLLRQRPLITDVPALIWQIGSLETRLHTTHRSKPERFDRFVSYLSQFYNSDHEVTAVYSSPHPLMPSTTLRFPLNKMREHADRFHGGFTLFIPACSQRPIRDIELKDQIDSIDHLNTITKQSSDPG